MSGVRAISSYGYSQYLARNPSTARPASRLGPNPPGGARLLSKSAPASQHYLSPPGRGIAVDPGREGTFDRRNARSTDHAASAPRLSKYSGTVRIIDLVASCDRSRTAASTSKPASRQGTSNLVQVALFKPSRSHPCALLSFNPSGSSILTSSTEGHSFHIFELRPSSVIGSSPGRHPTEAESSSHISTRDCCVWHRYRLNRGLTVARAVDAVWAPDSRYVAVSTSRGTSHVFPINPDGGRPGVDTHLSHNVRNHSFLTPLSFTVNALVRIKAPRAPQTAQDDSKRPQQQAFANSDRKHNVARPPDILFLPPGNVLDALRATSTTSRTVLNAVNLLAFYPHLGNLVYSKLALSASPKVAPSSAPLASRVTSQAMSGLTQMMRSGGSLPTTLESDQLLIREWKLAYWPLGRQASWPEFRQKIDGSMPNLGDRASVSASAAVPM